MKGTKQAKNLGGRPAKWEPPPGKRVHLSAAIPLKLKRTLEREAPKQQGMVP